MSHELRTPLNGILGHTQLLLMSENIPLKYKEELFTIQENGEHLLKLIQNILDIISINTNNKSINIRSFSLYELISDINKIFEIKSKDKNIDLFMMIYKVIKIL